MKAIQIKYMGPTNTKGARWKVWAEGVPAKIFNRNHDLSSEFDAENCAKEFAKDMNWFNPLVFGTLPNGDHVAVMLKILGGLDETRI